MCTVRLPWGWDCPLLLGVVCGVVLCRVWVCPLLVGVGVLCTRPSVSVLPRPTPLHVAGATLRSGYKKRAGWRVRWGMVADAGRRGSVAAGVAAAASMSAWVRVLVAEGVRDLDLQGSGVGGVYYM